MTGAGAGAGTGASKWRPVVGAGAGAGTCTVHFHRSITRPTSYWFADILCQYQCNDKEQDPH